MPISYTTACVGVVILNAINVRTHVRKALYYARIAIVIDRINNVINPTVLLIVIQYIYEKNTR